MRCTECHSSFTFFVYAHGPERQCRVMVVGISLLTIYFRALTEEQLYLESPNLARVMNFRDPGVRLISVPKGQRSRSQS